MGGGTWRKTRHRKLTACARCERPRAATFQATAEPAKLIEQAKSLDYGKSNTAAMLGMAAVELEKAERLAELRKVAEAKSRPFAGKPVRGREPKVPEVKQPHKPRKSAKPKKGKS